MNDPEFYRVVCFKSGGIKTTDQIVARWDLDESPLINQDHFPVLIGLEQEEIGRIYPCPGWRFERIDAFFKQHPELRRPKPGEGINFSNHLMWEEGANRRHVNKEYIIFPHPPPFIIFDGKGQLPLLHREGLFREIKLSPCDYVSCFTHFLAIEDISRASE